MGDKTWRFGDVLILTSVGFSGFYVTAKPLGRFCELEFSLKRGLPYSLPIFLAWWKAKRQPPPVARSLTNQW